MKKIFLRLGTKRYWLIIKDQSKYFGLRVIQLKKDDEDVRTETLQLMRAPSKNFDLEILHLALDPIEDLNIYVDKDDKSVLAWSIDSFKEQAEIDFKTKEEKDAFEEAYEEYYDKRWDDMPQVDMSIQDWEDLKQKWKKIKEEKPQYIIFTLDDSGPLDKVDVIGKDELSEQDKKEMQIEHDQYLKYQEARQKYIANHPDYSDIWRGPQDDEYEADIMKYYDED